MVQKNTKRICSILTTCDKLVLPLCKYTAREITTKKHLAIFNQLDVPRFKQFHAKTVERKIQGLQVHLAEMKALKTMLKDWDTFGLDEL